MEIFNTLNINTSVIGIEGLFGLQSSIKWDCDIDKREWGIKSIVPTIHEIKILGEKEPPDSEGDITIFQDNIDLNKFELYMQDTNALKPQHVHVDYIKNKIIIYF